MKIKLSTITLSLCMFFMSALSAQAWTYDFPTLDDASVYVGRYAPIAAPSAIGADGTVYQTGRYDKMIILGNDILENIATSAYITAIDPATQQPKWSVGLRGAARISQIITDGSDVYVAGTFADDVIFGSTDMLEQTFSGTSLSHDYVNAFVAKYSKDGVLQNVLPIYPHPNSKYTDRYTELGSDMMVEITAIALYGGKLYIGMEYRGGFTVKTIDKDGNLFAGDGLFFDALCLGVLAWDSTSGNVEDVLDFKGDKEITISNYGPFSLCLTSDEKAVHVGIFACNTNILTVNGEKTTASFDEDEYGAYLVKISDEVTIKKIPTAISERFYVENIIKKMQVVDGKLYIAGSIATPLPFKDTIVPDLWTDQFAACLDADTYETQWAAITGATKEEIPTTDGKYRKTTDAAYVLGNYVVAGSANFMVADGGMLTPLEIGETCLAVSASGSTVAYTTKTKEGSCLTVTNPLEDAIEIPAASSAADVEAVYSVDGVRRTAVQKGINIVKYTDGSVKKQIGR